MKTRIFLVLAAGVLTLGPHVLAQDKKTPETVKVGKYIYISSGPFLLMIEAKTDKAYALTGSSKRFGPDGGGSAEFAWVPILRYEDFETELVGRWRLDEIGGKPVKEREIFEFSPLGKLRYSRGNVVDRVAFPYRVTGPKKIVILLHGDKQELAWEIHNDQLIMTDVQTKEISKLTRVSK